MTDAVWGSGRAMHKAIREKAGRIPDDDMPLRAQIAGFLECSQTRIASGTAFIRNLISHYETTPTMTAAMKPGCSAVSYLR